MGQHAQFFKKIRLSLQNKKTAREQFNSMYKMVRVKGVEPPRHKTLDPKSSASANSATPAIFFKNGEP